MTETTGTVIDIKDGTAYVMTKACDIVRTKATEAMCPGMSVHLQLKPSNVLHSSRFPAGTTFSHHRPRYTAHERSRPRIAKCVIAVCLAIVMVLIPTIGFANPVYAWVSLDINPSFEFAINRYLVVLRATGLNIEAQELMHNTEFSGLTLDHSIRLALRLAASAGYAIGDAEHPIVIDATLQRLQTRNVTDQNTSSNGLSSLLENMKTQFKADSINAFVRMESSPIRAEAHRLELSIGRYAMMEMAKGTGAAVSTEEGRNMRLADLARLAGMRFDDANTTGEVKPPESRKNPSTDNQHEVVATADEHDATEQILDEETATTNGGLTVISDGNQEQSATKHKCQVETSNTVREPVQKADHEQSAVPHAHDRKSESSTGSAIVTTDDKSGLSTQNPPFGTTIQGSNAPENITASEVDHFHGDVDDPQQQTNATTSSSSAPPARDGEPAASLGNNPYADPVDTSSGASIAPKGMLSGNAKLGMGGK